MEEQFYFIFPFLVFFLSIRKLRLFLLIVILAVPLLRILFVNHAEQFTNDRFWVGQVLYSLTPFQLDALAVGSLLSIYHSTHLQKNLSRYIYLLLILVILIGISNLFLFTKYEIPFSISSLGFDIPIMHRLTGSPNLLFNFRFVYTLPILNIFFGFCLLFAISIKEYETGKIYTFFCFCGKISYGIYIWHLLFSFIFSTIIYKIINQINIKESLVFDIIACIIYFGFLILIANISYNYVEKHFLKLRKAY